MLFIILVIVILFLIYKLYELNKRLKVAIKLTNTYRTHSLSVAEQTAKLERLQLDLSYKNKRILYLEDKINEQNNNNSSSSVMRPFGGC